MKKLLTILVMMICCFSLTGCNFFSSKSKVPAPEKLAEMTMPKEMNVNVYIDGTSSMAGYVNFPGETEYEKAVFDIENISQQLFKNADVKFVKFGDKNSPIARDNLVSIKKVGFYNEKDTSIDKVVAGGDDKALNIIVTDLFQTDQDLGRLVNIFQSKYLKADKSLAIIGLKSQFNGKIYDIGKNVSSITYASNADPDTYRPVYLLVFGDRMAVRGFAKQFANANKDTKVALYDKFLGLNPALELSGDVPVELQKKDKKENLTSMAGGVRLVEAQDNLLQLRWKVDKSKAKVYVTLNTDDVVGDLPEAYKLDIQSFQYFDVPEKGKSGEFKDVDYKKVVQGTVIDESDDDFKAKIKMALTFAPNLNHKEGIYRMEFALVPTLEAYKESFNDFDSWNFDDSLLNSGVSLQAVGNKTLNLKRFLTQLANANYENKPGFYHNWLYIELK